jgi:hypothetical protein
VRLALQRGVGRAGGPLTPYTPPSPPAAAAVINPGNIESWRLKIAAALLSRDGVVDATLARGA